LACVYSTKRFLLILAHSLNYLREKEKEKINICRHHTSSDGAVTLNATYSKLWFFFSFFFLSIQSGSGGLNCGLCSDLHRFIANATDSRIHCPSFPNYFSFSFFLGNFPIGT